MIHWDNRYYHQLGLATVLALILMCSGLSVHGGATSAPDSFRVRKIILQGNTITRPQIILRELLFSDGDTLMTSDWDAISESSRRNLLNTSLFNFVTIERLDQGPITDIRISLIERWYIWPAPIFELTDRNLNTWWEARDYSRINYGFRVKWSNFRGRMENLDFILRFGKNQHYGLIYSLPYFDRRKRFGAGIELGYKGRHEVGYATVDDKLKFLYNEKYLSEEKTIGFQLTYRRTIHVLHSLAVAYNHLDLSDTLLAVNPGYYYPNRKEGSYLSIYYKLKADYRDARYYPLSGWYTDLEIYKAGFGNNPVDVSWIKSTTRYYCPLMSRWYTGFSLIGKITAPEGQPYHFMRGLGYDRDYVRGYEYYVVDGDHYLLTRNNIKYALIPERTANIGVIPTQKFSRIHYAAYLTLYADAGFVWGGKDHLEMSSALTEEFLLGGGMGLDLVTYYDKVLRVEYSFNKSGENGIFIHFIAGI